MDSFGVGGRNEGQGLPAAMSGVGTILNFIGNMGAASSAERASQRSMEAANFRAAQMEQQAGQTQAASQREAMIERRKTALLVSRGVAVAAASGGGASDPTINKLLSDITGEGAYRESVAIYQGEEKARQLNLGAAASRYEGQIAAAGQNERASAYRLHALGGLAAGGASLYSKYGLQGSPKMLKTKPISWDSGYDIYSSADYSYGIQDV